MLARELASAWESHSDPSLAAWSASLCASLWLAGLGPPPSRDALARVPAADAGVSDGLIHAAVVSARRHILELDLRGFQRSVSLVESLAASSSSVAAEVGRLSTLSWSALANGDAAGAARAADSAGALAARNKLAAQLVESQVLRSLAELEAGDLPAALDLARRAVRMAQAEELPSGEYLAAIALARARRLNNTPHLAARILTGLLRYAPLPWRNIIRWELVMSSGADAPGTARPTDGASVTSVDAPTTLLSWLRAADVADRAGFDSAETQLRELCAGYAPALNDLERASEIVDPDRADCSNSALAAWRAGATHELGFGLVGLAGIPTADVTTFACVISANAQHQPTRVLRVGASLVDAQWQVSSAATAKHSRTQTLLAVLAMAGEPGLAEADAFQQAYGFAYNPDLHRDTFNVAIHRARARLTPPDALVRGDGRLRLVLERRTAVPDPRCALPLGERVLRTVSRSVGINARSISSALGVSIRSAQAALEMLREGGACSLRKQGRSVEYLIEDTTFQEPTRHR